MGWYVNQGFNRSLLVQLSGGPSRYQIDVYVVGRFRFFYSAGAENWTVRQADQWKRRFINLAYHTWSEKWELRSAISCDSGINRSPEWYPPTARVRVHCVDVESPSIRLPLTQRLYAIKVYRRAPGEDRRHQWASLQPSDATVADAADGEELPTGTEEAQVYEDSLELNSPDANQTDDNRQVVAMHEFGHLLGLRHANSGASGCLQDINSNICYGEAYSPESGSIMGRGQEVRREDYRVFAHVMSRIVPSAWEPGLLIDTSRRLYWRVEGSVSAFCEGQNNSLASLDPEPRGTVRQANLPGPVGSRFS